MLAFLNSVPLTKWIERHDTPGPDVLRRLEQTKGTLPDVKLVIVLDRDMAGSLTELADAIRAAAGVELELVLAAEEPLPAAVAARIESAFGCPILDLADLSRLSGNVIVLLAGARPRPHGPRILVDALTRGEDVVLAYADEVEALAYGGFAKHWFKPAAHSPLLASQGNLLGNMVAVDLSTEAARAMLADAVSRRIGFRTALASMARHLSAEQVRHVSTVASISTRPAPPPLALTPPDLPPTLPAVSIIIPTRDGWNFLAPCLASLERTDWPPEKLEIIVVDNGSTDPATLAGLDAARRAGQIRVIVHNEEFNFARINNLAARDASGSILVFLNNDTEARAPHWLRQLVRFALLPRAGAIGPKLLFADGTVQHAGMILGMHGGAAHAFVGIGETEGGYQSLAITSREIGAVTGACIAITREAFTAVGGFNESFRIAFNDVMLCSDLIEAGYQNYYVAEPLFHHYESKTRGNNTNPQKIARERDERDRAAARHATLFGNDPFYSPCLSLDVPYGLAARPRRFAPWIDEGREP